MAKAMYLEHYLDSLESLPAEMQRNFNLMRDLDQRSQDLMKKIDKAATDYLNKVRHMSPEKRTNQLNQIESMFTKSREYGDDKVSLAMQTYEMVDKHIRKLDAELARFEADLKDKSSGRKKESPEGKAAGKKKNEKDKKKRKSNKEEFEDEIPKKKKKKGAQTEEETEIAAISPFPLTTHPSDVLDMPVDPNEPTYCLCNQVSYGEMIGCDNLDCPIEWFHFACVQLKTKPKGKWYCPRCQEERKKK
ncbi:inhibitor of growth protein 5-like isoform X2 [Physella acuta]|uniref:inhibitor of growth protein 5-like isoform X2 n=1 Tax=Physella acuta TaxID=109671 RepID=UPI0027DD72B2|nr:inhibitor of growth protein 5-like isoform X2 [Physella acuta]